MTQPAKTIALDGREPWTLRKPCRCGAGVGAPALLIRSTRRVDCDVCGQFVYWESKAEVGEAPRTVQSLRDVKPSQRARIIERATGRCELCGRKPPEVVLHVDHLVSVAVGAEAGLTEAELNDDENLAALCEECNLGKGERPISPRLFCAMLRARLRRSTP